VSLVPLLATVLGGYRRLLADYLSERASREGGMVNQTGGAGHPCI
jgi:hypothetical protein